MRNFFWKYLVILLALLGCSITFAQVTHHTKFWNTAIITGPFTKGSQFLYYLQPQLNFIDDKYKYQSSFLFVGVGYQLQPEIRLWLMNAIFQVKKTNGIVMHRDVLRQQLNWVIKKSAAINLSSISRLEERKRFSESTLSIRFRQQLALRLPLQKWAHHELVIFDEMFFDINHPAWTQSNTLLQQNRLFIGIGSELTPHTSVDVGYLNQYVFKKNDKMNNVLFIIFNVAAG